MHVHSPIILGQLKKKIGPITIIVWVLGRVEKMPKNGVKNNEKNIFFILNKYQDVTHIYNGFLKI